MSLVKCRPMLGSPFTFGDQSCGGGGEGWVWVLLWSFLLRWSCVVSLKTEGVPGIKPQVTSDELLNSPSNFPCVCL